MNCKACIYASMHKNSRIVLCTLVLNSFLNSVFFSSYIYFKWLWSVPDDMNFNCVIVKKGGWIGGWPWIFFMRNLSSNKNPNCLKFLSAFSSVGYKHEKNTLTFFYFATLQLVTTVKIKFTSGNFEFSFPWNFYLRDFVLLFFTKVFHCSTWLVVSL